MKSVICLFTNIDKARLAAETLILSGFSLEQMNIIVQETIAKNKLFISDHSLSRQENKEKYPLTGIERLLGGKQAIQTPDVGPVFCVGPEAINTAKAALSKPDQGLKFALSEFHLSEANAEYFRNGVKEGGLLLWITTDDLKAGEVVKAMEYRNGIRILTF